MTTKDDFTKACEQYIDDNGITNTVEVIADICRERGNVNRNHGLRATGNLWTHYGATLYSATETLNAPLEPEWAQLDRESMRASVSEA